MVKRRNSGPDLLGLLTKPPAFFSPLSAFLARLAMAVGFMSLLSMLVAGRVSWRAGVLLFLPLVCAGIASVVYWRLLDDLRFYLLVQFGSMLGVFSIMLFFPAGRMRNGHL